jgi:hypothetical protein
MTAAAEPSDATVRADEEESPAAPLTNTLDADLLRSLGELADLLGSGSETLNQCLLTVEDTLNALSITKDGWVPIQTVRSFIERVPPEDEETSQERVFGGVPVTIMKLGAPATQQDRTQPCEWRYEVGYSVVGDGRALTIRTASLEPSNERDGFGGFSDVKLLREAPLEIRLKAIREIPSLIIRLLDSGSSESVGGETPAGPSGPLVDSVEPVVYEAAS